MSELVLYFPDGILLYFNNLNIRCDEATMKKREKLNMEFNSINNNFIEDYICIHGDDELKYFDENIGSFHSNYSQYFTLLQKYLIEIQVGMNISCHWKSMSGEMYNAKIEKINDDKTITVAYTDGDKEYNVPRNRYKIMTL